MQEAYARLVQAAEEFKKSLKEFQQTFDPMTVGIDETCEHLDDIMIEIKEEMDSK